jgi:hypothetical protein
MVPGVIIMERKISLGENQDSYTLPREELGQDEIILEQDGQPVAAVVPIARYRAFQVWRKVQEEYSDEAFEREREAFERLKPTLLKTHAGKCVAVLNGEVVEMGDDKMAVLKRVYDRFGYVPVYVQQVESSPRVYAFPHRKVVS